MSMAARRDSNRHWIKLQWQVKSIANKRGKKAKEALEWYGGPYDPDDIDEQQVKITLGRLTNFHRTRRSKTVKKESRVGRLTLTRRSLLLRLEYAPRPPSENHVLGLRP
jgi:hypothetical protein